jgi:23S rRNA pseudouridine1911/1915/1917 synthase
MEDEIYTLTVEHEAVGQRLDRHLALSLAKLSRSFAQQLIDDGLVQVNGKPARASYLLRADDTIIVRRPHARPTELVAEPIPLKIIYEDADLVVINKPAGMVVHPAPGHASGTLVNALLARYPDMEVGGDLRPGIVHRLDQDTSGLIVVARNDRALQQLADQQRERAMNKVYLAIVEGRMQQPSGVVDAPVGRHPRDRLRMAVVDGGREARTHYRLLEDLGAYSLLEVTLETGRTHQIRVHMRHINRPVIGDPLYGPGEKRPRFGLTRQFLHAQRLGLRLPSDGSWREFVAPLPDDLERVLNKLRAIAKQ